MILSISKLLGFDSAIQSRSPILPEFLQTMSFTLLSFQTKWVSEMICWFTLECYVDRVFAWFDFWI